MNEDNEEQAEEIYKLQCRIAVLEERVTALELENRIDTIIARAEGRQKAKL